MKITSVKSFKLFKVVQICMKGRRSILDTFAGRFYMVGPGGYELEFSPGSEKFDLEESPMGHQMLPCSKFDEHCHQTNDSMSFLVGN